MRKGMRGRDGLVTIAVGILLTCHRWNPNVVSRFSPSLKCVHWEIFPQDFSSHLRCLNTEYYVMCVGWKFPAISPRTWCKLGRRFISHQKERKSYVWLNAWLWGRGGSLKWIFLKRTRRIDKLWGDNEGKVSGLTSKALPSISSGVANLTSFSRIATYP